VGFESGRSNVKLGTTRANALTSELLVLHSMHIYY